MGENYFDDYDVENANDVDDVDIIDELILNDDDDNDDDDDDELNLNIHDFDDDVDLNLYNEIWLRYHFLWEEARNAAEQTDILDQHKVRLFTLLERPTSEDIRCVKGAGGWGHSLYHLRFTLLIQFLDAFLHLYKRVCPSHI